MLKNRNLIIIAIVVFMLVGAAFTLNNFLNPSTADDGILVTVSFYPLAYFAEAIGGENVLVSSLIPYNNEVHSWQPSISDITNAEESDLIISLGAGLDHWMEDDILTAIDIEGKIIREASEGITLLAGSDDHDDDDHTHEEGDPHLWVSPHTALQLAENVYNAIRDTDPSNGDYYQENWEQLQATLSEIDNMYRNELEQASGKTFFVIHSAYGYIADGYGLEQHGLIGVSADEQPSTPQMVEIVELMIAENSYVIFVDPVYSEEYAQTLSTELGSRTGEDVQILPLSLILGPIDDIDYLGQLEANLENLVIGLVE